MAKKDITYLVKRRMDLGFIVPPGVLVRGSDVPDVPLLVDRGFLQPVPEDYPADLFTPPDPAKPKKPSSSASSAQPPEPESKPEPTVPEGVDPTTSQLPPADFIPASTPGVDLPKTIDLSDVGT